MQKVQLKSWGNSVGIRIPRNILDDLDLKVNSFLEISVDKDKKSIILKVDDGLTPYQRLMAKNQKTKERKQIVWDRIEEEKRQYQ